MAVNKVNLTNGETLLDLTADTVEPETLAEGVTAHNSNGEQIIGTMKSGGGDEEFVEILIENDEVETLDLPDYVTKIKPFAFYNSKLKAIRGFEVTEFVDRMEEWYDEETGETEVYPAQNNAFENCYDLLYFIFPKLERIGEWSFAYANLEEMEELPDSVKYIGGSAFSGSTIPLTKLPKNLEEIGAFSFSRCPFLTITEIPASVKNIYNRAFIGCSNLSTITFKGKPELIANDAFGNWWAEDPEEAESYVTTINVPWAEGEVAGAPYGAIGATINYNYTGG